MSLNNSELQVKRIIQQDEDIGKMAAAVPLMVAKMSEIFITKLLEKSGKVMEDRGSRTLSVDHLAGAIRDDVRYVSTCVEFDDTCL